MEVDTWGLEKPAAMVKKKGLHQSFTTFSTQDELEDASQVRATKGPSQKYLEANEVKYFSLWGGGRRFHGHYFTFSTKNWLHACAYHHRMKPKVGRNFTSERGEGVKGEVKNISLHWLQGIFETVPNTTSGKSFWWFDMPDRFR